jgi:hypothetical protein
MATPVPKVVIWISALDRESGVHLKTQFLGENRTWKRRQRNMLITSPLSAQMKRQITRKILMLVNHSSVKKKQESRGSWGR